MAKSVCALLPRQTGNRTFKQLIWTDIFNFDVRICPPEFEFFHQLPDQRIIKGRSCESVYPGFKAEQISS